MMGYYPVGLNLKNKDILIVGAGPVAERKIKALLPFGARIRVVAPETTTRIARLAKNRTISLARRRYRPSDAGGMRLVIAATSDDAVNARVSKDAGKRGIWVNVVDDTKKCDFISTAIIRTRGIVISISTDGKRPIVSREFKKFLREKIGEFNFNRN